MGHVILVTLAKDPWVLTSAENFAPTIGETILRLGIPIIYAQEGNQIDYDKNAMQSDDDIEKYWSMVKGKAISREIAKFYTQYEGQSWKNVISIGDADFERLGTQAATKEYMMGLVKSEATKK